jgi:hypothetical protein
MPELQFLKARRPRLESKSQPAPKNAVESERLAIDSMLRTKEEDIKVVAQVPIPS